MFCFSSRPRRDYHFSDEEWEQFQTRVDEGYDLAPTGRYLEWLKIYHPDHIPQGIACVCMFLIVVRPTNLATFTL